MSYRKIVVAWHGSGYYRARTIHFIIDSDSYNCGHALHSYAKDKLYTGETHA